MLCYPIVGTILFFSTSLSFTYCSQCLSKVSERGSYCLSTNLSDNTNILEVFSNRWISIKQNKSEATPSFNDVAS